MALLVFGRHISLNAGTETSFVFYSNPFGYLILVGHFDQNLGYFLAHTEQPVLKDCFFSTSSNLETILHILFELPCFWNNLTQI